MKRILLIVLFLLAVTLFAQEIDNPSESDSDTPVLTESSDEISQTIKSLEERYRLRELETATLEELRYLAEQAGLNSNGDLNSLLNRLKQHYSLNPEVITSDEETDEENPEEGEEEKNGPVSITIESADSTRAIEVEEKGGQEIILQGRVVLSILQEGQGISHSIHADRVTFSQINDQVTATGDILYIRKEGEKTESFTGDSLTFQMRGWKGIIYNGLSQRDDQQDEGEVITFFFRGEQFKTSGNDQFIMEKGVITSGNPENPTYQIRAKKIWILAPQEWGLSHGRLYLGRVPLLYIPFYYRPGNEMFFNPVMGYRDREGALIQTTTYLIGRKDSENDSFFNAGLVTDESYELDRQGLFLFKTDKLQEAQSDNFLKFMGDYYTRLGIYTALQGSFKTDSFDSTLRLGTGFSHNIDNEGSIYSNPNNINDNKLENEVNIYYDIKNQPDTWVTRSHNTYFYGLNLPFRWEASLTLNWGQLKVNLEYLSDGAFRKDFHSRSETFDWLTWLLEERDKDFVAEEGITGSLSNSIRYSQNIDVTSLKPWINRLNFNDISMEFLLQKGTDTALQKDAPTDPRIYFFYPNKVLPWVKLSMAGQLFDWDSNPNQGVRQSSSVQGVNPPITVQENEEEKSDFESLFQIKNRLPLPSSIPSSATLSWSFSPQTKMDIPFRSNQWVNPSLVDASLDYTEWKTDFNGSLKLTYSTLNQMLQVNDTQTFSGKWKEHIDLFSSIDPVRFPLSQEVQDSDSLYDQYSWNNNLVVTLSPFKDISFVQNSTISHSFSHDIYKWYRTREEESVNVVDKWYSNQDEMVKTNKTTANLQFQPVTNLSINGSYSWEYYPISTRDRQNWNMGLNFSMGPFIQSFSQGASWEPSVWKMQKFTSNSSLGFFDNSLRINNTFNYDTEEEEFDKNSISLKAWDFSATALLQNSPVYNWNNETSIWEAETEEVQVGNVTEEEIVDSVHWESLNLSYSPNRELPPLWKDRITQNINMTINWNMNLNKVNNNSLTMNLTYSLGIHEFMKLNFSLVSGNDNMYIYFPQFRDELGIPSEQNLIEDLVKSFNFFSPDQIDRKESSFNLKTFSLSATHYMGNWTALLEYSGHPEIVEMETEWKSTFSFVVQWAPIPNIRSRFENNEQDKWSALTEW